MPTPSLKSQRESRARLIQHAGDASELPVSVVVGDSAIALTGRFEVGDDPVASAIELLGQDADRRLKGVELSDPVEVAGGSWVQATHAGVPVVGEGILVRSTVGVTDRVLLQAAQQRKWPRPRKSDPAAAIDFVRRVRALPEDLDDPPVPDPQLVWFDPSTLFADGDGPPQLAWQFTFTGDRPGIVIVDTDGTDVLAIISNGDADNAFQHFTTPRFALDPVTGVPRFVTFHPPLILPSATSGSAVTVATDFFSTFPRMFGTAAPAMQLQPVREETDLDGGRHVVFDQYHGGVRVHGCQLIVHLNDTLAITSVSGRFFRDPDVDIDPTIAEGFAYSIAASDWVRTNGDDHVGQGQTIESRGLVILPWRLLDPNGSNSLAWWFRYPDHDRFVSAHTGRVVGRLPRTKSARRVFDGLAGPPGTAGELHLQDGIQQTPNPLDPEAAGADAAIAATDAFWRLFARNSWDGRGGGYDAVVDVDFDLPSTPVLEVNARWNGSFTEFSRNFGEADVIAHEFTHALTDTTADLVYLFEPGALNESYSDVFGKLIAPTPQQWTIGVGAGISRDLQDPPTTPVTPGVGNYAAFSVMNVMTDRGGVHTNSGIGNRAAVLTCDGDANHPGIGRPKLARLYYDTLTSRLTPWSQYIDQLVNTWQVAVERAAAGSLGAMFPGAGPPPAFTAADPRQVLWAFDQVGLRMDLFAGWYQVPSNATTDYVFNEGLATAANETVSDVIIRVSRVRGDRTQAFLGLLQVSTGSTSRSFAGGMITATITQHGVGSTDREVRVRVTVANLADVDVSAQIVTISTTPNPPPPNLPYPTRRISHWFDNPFFAGRRYGDIIHQSGMLPSNCTVTDVVLELMAANNAILARTRLGEPPAVAGSAGAWIFSRQTGGTDIEVRVRSWHDFGAVVRYRLVYWVTGDPVVFPAFALNEVGANKL